MGRGQVCSFWYLKWSIICRFPFVFWFAQYWWGLLKASFYPCTLLLLLLLFFTTINTINYIDHLMSRFFSGMGLLYFVFYRQLMPRVKFEIGPITISKGWTCKYMTWNSHDGAMSSMFLAQLHVTGHQRWNEQSFLGIVFRLSWQYNYREFTTIFWSRSLITSPKNRLFWSPVLWSFTYQASFGLENETWMFPHPECACECFA